MKRVQSEENIINILPGIKSRMYNKIKILIYYPMWKMAPKRLAEIKYKKKLHKTIDWNNPKDLNEKINWLKFHSDQHIWARLADKYAVREYVKEKGLEDILIPLYGKYECADDLLNDLDNLPEEYVIKSNNGCAHVLVVDAERRKKLINGNEENKKKLKKLVKEWLSERTYGIINVEMHYQYIKNCIIVEGLLKDKTVSEFSRSIIDYKIYCSDGKPNICYVAYDRDPISHKRFGDIYDLNWARKSEYMREGKVGKEIPRPRNWEKMLEYASILSEGLPQVRVDLYNIDGQIYFGEMTMASGGGLDIEFTQEFFDYLGSKVIIDHSTPGNEFWKER